MNNLIFDSQDQPRDVGFVPARPLPGQRKISGLLVGTLMCAVCALSPHSRASAVTLDGGASPAAYVNGTPRLTHGHPDTLWDSEDMDAYKAAFATNPALKAAFEQLQAAGDKRIAEPLDIPARGVDADGSWTYPDFKRGSQDASGNWHWEWVFNGNIQKRAEDVSNLGILYALTGDEKYAVFAKQILLGLVDAYGYGKGSTAPDPYGFDHFEAYGFDGGDIGMFLAKACNGYDLILNASSISSKERAQIETALIRPMAEHLNKRSSFMYTTHDRWGMVCLYGIFIAGETLNDPSLINLSLYGPDGSKDNVTGGFMDCFKPNFLHEGAIWGAGSSIDDQMSALSVMTTVAEVMWHRGVNLYAYHDAVVKQSFDAALKSSSGQEASKLLSIPGIDAYPYAFRRYQDQRYMSVVHQLTPGFTLAIGEHLPSPPVSAATAK